MSSFYMKLRISVFFIILTAFISSCLGNSQEINKTQNVNAIIKTGNKKQSYQIPKNLTICGERIPLENPGVYERLEYEFLMILAQPEQVQLWQKRANIYFPLIEADLKKNGLPDDLKYLAVAESDLRPTVVSPAGALGLWQFMPGTAREFGLKVNKEQDERKLTNHSLTAGQKFLSQLNNRFNSWALAMAAYNAGGGRISGAMKQQGTSTYYELNLARETERYVYRIAAIKVIMENANAYGIKAQIPNNLYNPSVFTETSKKFEKDTTWVELAKELKVDYKILRMLNPHLNGASLKGGPYKIRLPK